MKRKIIQIDQDKCNGCGNCIPGCPEGALQVIDGKARLVSDLMCDGLGACLGHCPEGAITVEEREAAPYDETLVMAEIVKQGSNTIRAHLDHLKAHNEAEYYSQAVQYLQVRSIPVPEEKRSPGATHGCPGARAVSIRHPQPDSAAPTPGDQQSELTHWPVQMRLLSPNARHYQDSDMILAADCVAYAMGNFHRDWLQGRTLGIACPKLDEGQDVYVEKIRALIDVARIRSLTVMIMQVPCCRGLLRLAQTAASQSARNIPVRCVVVGVDGQILA